jgi:His-Xaa-Ser system radical SAM maturase HxsC
VGGEAPRGLSVPAVTLCEEFGYLGDGDIVRINPRVQQLRVIYRRSAAFNSLLVTERCNSYCVMCSQPPKDVDDSFLVDELLEAIPLMGRDTPELGLTGGEPTLLGGGLRKIIAATRDWLPATSLHVLTNGRAFEHAAEAERIAAIRHHDLMLGIPLYSDLPDVHDFVVQAAGAYDQTVRGLLNLARAGVPIELRVVLHRYTYERLPDLARFVVRNLPFVNHVALMGLEMMGHVKMNLDALWVDPADYQGELRAAVETLHLGGVRPIIFNHQLCVLDRSLWPDAKKTISDWKNVYMPECEGCTVRRECGGFFASAATRYSSHIHAIDTQNGQMAP